MQLKIKRSMEMKGLVFQASYSASTSAQTIPERTRSHQLLQPRGLLLQKESLTVTIKPLKDGHYTECPDLGNLWKTEKSYTPFARI